LHSYTHKRAEKYQDGAVCRKQALDAQLLGEKSRALNLQAAIEDAGLYITGVRIIPVDDGIYDGLAQRLQLIIN
jgi:hypothetical protein